MYRCGPTRWTCTQATCSIQDQLAGQGGVPNLVEKENCRILPVTKTTRRSPASDPGGCGMEERTETRSEVQPERYRPIGVMYCTSSCGAGSASAIEALVARGARRGAAGDALCARRSRRGRAIAMRVVIGRCRRVWARRRSRCRGRAYSIREVRRRVEWHSTLLPRYQRRTRVIDQSLVGAYLSGRKYAARARGAGAAPRQGADFEEHGQSCASVLARRVRELAAASAR